MTRPSQKAVIAFVALLLIATALPAAAIPPNIVLIVIDDLGWTGLGCQGSTFYETPHIDRLAAAGMRFTNAYANCTVCSPSRAALMTGKYPGRVGFTGHITAIGRHRYRPHGRIIPPDDYLYLRHQETTFAEALRQVGYVSASIGKWHLGSEHYWPLTQGFDVNVGGYDHGAPPGYFFPYTKPESAHNPALLNLDRGTPGEYLTDRLTDEALRFIRIHQHEPFLLYLPHYAVHTPLEAPAELVEKYERKLKTDDSQIDATYAAMIEKVDDSIGRISATLDELGLTERTLFIVTSDNGGELRATRNAPLRSGKGHVYEGGLRIPLIVRWPGQVKPGQVSSVPVTNADLFPTILAATGLTNHQAERRNHTFRASSPANRPAGLPMPHAPQPGRTLPDSSREVPSTAFARGHAERRNHTFRASSPANQAVALPNDYTRHASRTSPDSAPAAPSAAFPEGRADQLDGVSLLPLLTGESQPSPRDLFWYYPHYGPQGGDPGAVIRSGNYKLIRFYDPPRVELYNLAEDLGERTDLSATMPEKAIELLNRLDGWVEQNVPTPHTDNPNYDPAFAGKERPQ